MKGFVTTNFDGRYPVANFHGFTGYLYAGVENLFGVKYQEATGTRCPPRRFTVGYNCGIRFRSFGIIDWGPFGAGFPDGKDLLAS